MIELKTFYEQAQKLRIAQRRCDDLATSEGVWTEELQKTLIDAAHIRTQLEEDFDNTLAALDKQLRIAPEQVNADEYLSNALEVSIKNWRQDLEVIQKEIIDQALLDSKATAKSARLTMLETREKELTDMIADAERKLGRVSGRIAQSGLGNIKGTVDEILNEAKP